MTAPGRFEAKVDRLTPDTTYRFRARATGVGTVFGEEITFRTPHDLSAEGGQEVGQDTDGVAVINIKLNRVKDASGNTVPVTNGISAYTAGITRSGEGVQFTSVRGVPPFGNAAISTSGLFTGSASNPTGSERITLGRIPIRLVGTVTASCSVTLTLNSIIRSSDNGIIPCGQATTLTFRRGDANSDGVVNIFDAMYIAQVIVGTRPLGAINTINAASVKHDGESGDRVDIFDALFISQYVVGTRNSSFE